MDEIVVTEKIKTLAVVGSLLKDGCKAELIATQLTISVKRAKALVGVIERREADLE